jgi:glucose/arabinose dehydrogenase
LHRCRNDQPSLVENVVASADGSKLYASIGSNSNAAENGFVNANGDAIGRPVGVAIDRQGALLVGDDVGNTTWRVHRR